VRIRAGILTRHAAGEEFRVHGAHGTRLALRVVIDSFPGRRVPMKATESFSRMLAA